MSKSRIVVVEDDPSINELICYNLEREGYDVVGIDNAHDALAVISTQRPCLVLLDIMLPGIDGFDVCQRLRSTLVTKDILIIMLTARGGEADIVKGLQVGADDYVVKPFSPLVLLARVKAVLRRGSIQEQLQTASTRQYRDLTIDRSRRRIFFKRSAIDVTTLEFDILEFLSRSPGRVYTRDQLLDSVWKEGSAVVDRAVDVHMRNLRKKMGLAADYIETVRGVGVSLPRGL
jgi:two-component system phosphate regulon response regulator PhoB